MTPMNYLTQVAEQAAYDEYSFSSGDERHPHTASKTHPLHPPHPSDHRIPSPAASLSSQSNEFIAAALKSLKKATKHGRGHRLKAHPARSIKRHEGWSLEDRAKEGIFVVDPVHRERAINREFLQCFLKAATEQGKDLSYMGFITSSSSSDELANENGSGSGQSGSLFLDWDRLDGHEKAPPVRPSSASRKRSSHAAKKERPASSSIHADARIIVSSSLTRPADNSHNFPSSLTAEQVEILHRRVCANYRNYSQALRHGSTPMDICDAPGVLLLTEDEFVACCCLRIRPALYFHARNTLLHNFHHGIGYFRKSAAQKMLRIDVNKTGKLYDFLVKQRWLPAAADGECRAEPAQVIIDDAQIVHQL
jgi:hypothetical protein